MTEPGFKLYQGHLDFLGAAQSSTPQNPGSLRSLHSYAHLLSGITLGTIAVNYIFYL